MSDQPQRRDPPIGYVLAMVVGICLGMWTGYNMGVRTAEESAFHQGYCAGLDIADSTCEDREP